MERSSLAHSSWFSAISGLAGLITSLGLGYLALSQELPPPAVEQTAALAPPPPLEPCVMDRDGYWTGRVFGSEELDLDWRGNALTCAGNARPDGKGLRLFFAGFTAPGTDRLVLVLGIDAGIDGLAGREFPVSLTLIDEASSQFFHTADRCFTFIRDVAPLAAAGSYRVEGDLYCAGAIPALSGTGSVTLGDMTYAGRITLDRN
jgi:hypothetical protein